MVISNHQIQYASEHLERLGYKDVLFLNEKEPTHGLDSHHMLFSKQLIQRTMIKCYLFI